MGQLREKRIIQSRNWLDPNQVPIPPFDYDFVYPITVFEAVKRTMDDNSSNLSDELEAIYRLIGGKQNIIQGGTLGNLMTWSGINGEIGSMEVVRAINADPSLRSHSKIPTERAIGDALTAKASVTSLNAHTNDFAIHVTDVERTRWNSMAPLSTLQSHINNTNVHITNEERARWNAKANQTELDEHRYDTNNPHNVTAHQVGTYTRKEVDDLFAALRESFFNYMNIQWDPSNNMAELVRYHPANWNPNYVLSYNDELPDVPAKPVGSPDRTFFAVRPATDYTVGETDDIVIWVKREGLMWQEVGFAHLKAGDMVIRFPDTVMYVWIQGRFLRLFSNSGDSGDPGTGTGGDSTTFWYPVEGPEGYIHWVKSSTTEPPSPMKIKGDDGKTPIKGIDYDDGKDGKGVSVGGAEGDVLVKLSNENYDTSWKSIRDLFEDLVIAGFTLPTNLVEWKSVQGRPVWYDEPGNNSDGFITQRAATNLYSTLNDKLTEVLSKVDGPAGLDGVRKDLYDHINDFNNPHRVTPAQIGAVSIAAFNNHVQNFNNPHNVTREHLGLEKVENTSDKDKPISDATQAAINELKNKLALINNDVDEMNFITNVTWKNNVSSLLFTFNDGSLVTIAIPFKELFSSMYFDSATKELVIVLPDGTKHRINIADLIQAYVGNMGQHIHTYVEGNIIKADIIAGSIGSLEITPSVHLRLSPTTTTQPVGDKSTRIATTEFVKGQVIDNLISYEVDRPLSANMGRILNQRKVDIEDLLQIINDMEGISVIDHLDSTSPLAALSANMGRYLDLTKAPRVHTSPSGSTFGRATISLFGHARASEVDPLMDGTVFRGTDDGYFARADHRHPTDITRAPLHWPDNGVDDPNYPPMMTGRPRTPTPPDDSNDTRTANTEWVRRNAVGVSKGFCTTGATEEDKVVTLVSTYVAAPVPFIRQLGSTVAITMSATDTSGGTTRIDVNNTGFAPVYFAGRPIEEGMLNKNCSHIIVFSDNEFGTDPHWELINPYRMPIAKDDANDGHIATTEWVRRNSVGVNKGTCTTPGNVAAKTANLQSTFMNPVVFMRQIGSTVAIRFKDEDISGNTETTLNVQGTGAAGVRFGGSKLKNGMIGKDHTHMFTFDGTFWWIINPVPGTGQTGDDGITIGPGKPPVTEKPSEDEYCCPDCPYCDKTTPCCDKCDDCLICGSHTDDCDCCPDCPDCDCDDCKYGNGTIVNRITGYQGLTVTGGITDEHGQVNRVNVAIPYGPFQNDVKFSLSTKSNDWAIRMSDDTFINLRNPVVLETTRTNAIVQFEMNTMYPSNSPCLLVYHRETAWFNVVEI